MPLRKRTCSVCDKQFTELPNKPGLVHQCPNCSIETTECVGGNMIWTHKTGPSIEIKSMKEAKNFARLQSRFGVGPLRSIVEAKEPSPKRGSGAAEGEQYVTRLGEKRYVKR